MKYNFASIIALVATASSTAVDLHRRTSPLDVSLTQLGNSKVKATVTNTGSTGYNLLYKGSLLDSSPVEKLQVSSKMAMAKFDGGVKMRLATSGLSEDAFMPIEAGQTIEVEVDMAELYDVSTSDAYDVLASGAIPYAEMGSTELTGDSLSYSSNKITMDIDGVQAAKVVKAISAKKVSMEKRTQLANDCSSSKRSALVTAISNCQYLANQASTAARSGSASRFQEYFKSTSSSVRNTVANRLSAVASDCGSTSSGATDTYCTDFYGECSGNVLAYTDPSTNEIVYCDLFFNDLPGVSQRCHGQDQATTVIHEETHAPAVYSPGTKDNGYGYNAATSLSSSQAVNNADSYALFANAVYLNC